jgi:hypothetical protein
MSMGARLRDLRINQVPFWYQTYLGEVDEVDEDGNLTGETARKFSNPVKALARISPNTGQSESSPFGADLDYDKSISTVVRLPIDEYSRLFIDIEPVINEDGTTDTEPDYYCVVPKHDLQQNVWAVKKIRAVVPHESV